MIKLTIFTPPVSTQLLDVPMMTTVGELREILKCDFPIHNVTGVLLSETAVMKCIYPKLRGTIIIADNSYRANKEDYMDIIRSSEWLQTNLTGFGPLPKIMDLLVERWLPDYILSSNLDRSHMKGLLISYFGDKATNVGKILKHMRFVRNQLEHRYSVSDRMVKDLFAYLSVLRRELLNSSQSTEIIELIDSLLCYEDTPSTQVEEWEGSVLDLQTYNDRKKYKGSKFLMLSGKHENTHMTLVRFNGTNVHFMKEDGSVIGVGSKIRVRLAK